MKCIVLNKMKFTSDYIIVDEPDIINKMLLNRDSFDKTISEILNKYFNENTRNNRVYFKIMDLTTSQRHKFHTYERPDIILYSVGYQECRTMIIEFKTRYITNVLKKYDNISEEFSLIKKIITTDVNKIIDNKLGELLTKIKNIK